MGQSQSTHTTPEIKDVPCNEEFSQSSESGRKNSDTYKVQEEPCLISTDDEHDNESVVASDSDEKSDSDDEDEEWYERSLIFADIQALKKLAVDYLHPEKPVITTDACACGRNYFTRPSAFVTQADDDDDDEERVRILSEAQALKKLAVDYLHPEKPVVSTDAFACGRNYFTRPSAPESEDLDEVEERARVLLEAQALKRVAVDYLHPEKPVDITDACACGRNYFTRPSAFVTQADEEDDERVHILADAQALKKLAVDYLHPEKPVKTTDPLATARNYFDRPSAPIHEHYIHSVGTFLTVHDENYVANDYPSDNMIHYHHYHHYGLHDDNSQSSYDHFDMDEDVFTEFRESLVSTVDAFKGEHPLEIDEEIEKEGNLSRSPSSVMLFNEVEAM